MTRAQSRLLVLTCKAWCVMCQPYTAEPSLWRAVPSEAQVVSWVNLESLQRSGTAQAWVKLQLNKQGLEALRQMGISDPVSQLREALALEVANGSERSWALIARLASPAPMSTPRRDARPDELGAAQSGHTPPVEVVWLDSATLLVGSPQQLVKSVRERWNAVEHPPTGARPRWVTLQRRYQALLRLEGPPTTIARRIRHPLLRAAAEGDLVRNIRWMEVGIRVGSPLELEVETELRNPQQAAAFCELARFTLWGLAVQAQGDAARRWKDTLARLKTQVVDARAHVSMQIEEQTLLEILERFEQYVSIE